MAEETGSSSPDRAASERRQDLRRRRWEVLTPAIAALLGALIGGGATYLVANLTIRDQQQKDVRTQRATAYSAFLSAAEGYAQASFDVINKCHLSDRPVTCPAKELEDLQAARSDYQGAVNNVYIYGSDRAVDALQKVAATLPPSVAKLDQSFSVQNVNQAAFSKAYNAFLHVMCQDVSPAPNRRC